MAMTPWMESVTGRTNAEMDAYRANKSAMGGATINQQNLDAAAAVGALGTDASGATVRNPNAASGMDAYLDEIMQMLTPVGNNNAPQPAPTGRGAPVNNNVAPVPQADPRGRGPKPKPENGPVVRQVQTIPYTEEDINKLETGLAQGIGWEAILGGALGGGVVAAAKAFYDNWQKNSGGAGNGPTANTNKPNNTMPVTTGPRNGPHPFAQVDNAAGGTYLEWLMNPEVSGVKETPKERLGHVVDGTFTDPTKMTAITHANPTDMFNAMRQELIANQSGGGNTGGNAVAKTTNQTNNNVVQGTFSQFNSQGDPSKLLTPEQISTVVRATTMGQEGYTSEEIIKAIQNSGVDLTNEAVANAVRQVITGAF